MVVSAQHLVSAARLREGGEWGLGLAGRDARTPRRGRRKAWELERC